MAYFPQGVSPSVSSALGRFTSVFGMGTGGTTPLEPPGGSLPRKQLGITDTKNNNSIRGTEMQSESVSLINRLPVIWPKLLAPYFGYGPNGLPGKITIYRVTFS